MGETSSTAPLSYAQERLWFLQQVEPESSAYNLRTAYRFSGRLDAGILATALAEIVRRHEVLRTTFVEENGAPVQIVGEARALELETIDLRHEPRAAAELRRLVRERLRQRFDLTRQPLMRPALFRLGDQEYVLLLVLHHIIFDGWSADVLLDELLESYEALIAGRAPLLPEPPMQYVEFARWQRRHLEGGALEPHLDYWQSRLAQAPMTLDLPTDRPRSAAGSSQAAFEQADLGPELGERVRRLSLEERATPFMTMLAAFAVLLRRYSGQDDLLIGTPIASRNRAEIERLIGFFVNTLVLRVDVGGDPSFRELVGRVRDVCLGAFEHQDLPFEKLVEALKPPRDLDRTPLFQVLFLFQNTPRSNLERAGLAVSHLEIPAGTGRFDLALAVFDGEKLTADYRSDLFDRETVAGMLRQYGRLLHSATATADLPISTLSLLSRNERRRLLVEWNPPTTESAVEERLERLFEQQVVRTPQAPALVGADGASLSYERLNGWANRIARRLEQAGLPPEPVVGVHLDRSPAMIAAILGILKAGGAWLPLDPAAPQRRSRFMAEEAGMSIVLTRLESEGPAVAGLEALPVDEPALADGPDPGNPVAAPPPGALAYVLYTSGSTGRPTGVLGLHGGAVARLRWMWRRFPFREGEVCCQKTAASFVDSVWEIFGPLLRGVPQVLIDDSKVREPRLLVERLAAEHVTRIVLVPSLLRALLEVGGDQLGRKLPDLTTWISSGETLPAALARRWRQAVGEVPVLLNLYGSTECAGDSLWHEVGSDDGWSVPLGRPIDETRVYILDGLMEPVPPRVAGELYIGGAGLARGYLGRPAQTAASFVPDPFAEEPGSRLYRTGDRARYRADGAIEFEGRGDLQVKLRGHRIELGEVEAALADHPAVAAAAVTVAGEGPTRRLLAYWAPATGEPESSELREWLAGRLPSYMLPAALVKMAALPRTASGKIDRPSLPEPEGFEHSGDGLVAPRDQLEQQLVGLWARLLRVDRVGLRDDFFELGGHSLLAVELLSRIEQLTGRRLPLASLVRSATVEAVATTLREQGWSSEWRSLVPIRRAGFKRPIFCVPGAGGHLLYYRELARHLDQERPFYGLQARGLEGDDEVLDSVEEMARHYVQEMRTVQPSGPYLIGGSCFGGAVAYEMALRLTAAGHSVSRLLLLEAYAPSTGPIPIEVRTRVATWLRRRGRGRRFGDLWRRARRWLRGRPGGPLHGSLERAMVEVMRASIDARLNYRPRPYSGRVTVFQGSDRPSGYAYPERMGWPDLVTGRIDVESVPGFHTGVFREPLVRELAARLNATLDQVDRETAQS